MARLKPRTPLGLTSKRKLKSAREILGFTADSKTIDAIDTKRPKYAPHVCPGTRYQGGHHGFRGYGERVCFYCGLPPDPDHNYEALKLDLIDMGPSDPRRHAKR
jgi:hypothetical protein